LRRDVFRRPRITYVATVIGDAAQIADKEPERSKLSSPVLEEPARLGRRAEDRADEPIARLS